jgi:hypothetical protein
VTSYRPGTQRWSELAIYLLPDGTYILSKIGRSLVAHRPECARVTWKMVSWLEAGEEGKVRRVPCVACRPVIGNEMDPHTVLEPSRYSARSAQDAQALLEMLLEGRAVDTLPWVVREALVKATASDPLGLGSLPALLSLGARS